MNAQISSDEEFARQLLEQEQKEIEKAYKRDYELAKQLEGSSHDKTVINLVDSDSDHEENDFKLALKLQQSFNNINTIVDADFEFAKKLQEVESSALAKIIDNKEKHRIIDKDILNDTIPDLYELFLYFNRTYFNDKLASVEVKWSKRMTRCAGTCTFKLGNYCIITLSEPLLKFRSKSDMIDTLLHEMIHALLFLTQRNTDKDGHGPEFLKEANRINQLAKTNITIYHNFHDEVDHYLTHVWQCNGICQNIPPYFGIVKRSMNRPPQPADSWYSQHQLTCGGTFTKIREPSNNNNKNSKKRPSDLLSYFEQDTKKSKKN